MDPETRFLEVAGRRLEYAWHGPGPEAAPTLVFLHEGLGCVRLWRDFPARLAAATGLGAFVYSRWGYGLSDPVALPRSVRYMHDEALEVLPQVLAAAGIGDSVLVGHSDGASIALIWAGGTSAPGLRGLIVEAAHVFCEDVSVQSIAAAARAYETGDLKDRLARYHGSNTECAFRGWNEPWLDPEFRHWNLEGYLPAIRVPTLVIQGEDDEYGTGRQVEAIAAGIGDRAEVLMLPDCGHSPHRDRPDRVLAAMADFVRRLGL